MAMMVRAADVVREKPDLVAIFERLKSFRVRHFEDHRHAWHVEIGNRTVLDGHLSLLFVDLPNHALGIRRRRGCRRRRDLG
jgi:hypothetical protein